VAIDRSGLVLDGNEEANPILDGDIRQRHLTTTDRGASVSLQTLTVRFLATREDVRLVAQPIVVRRKGKSSIVPRMLPAAPVTQNPPLGARALLTFPAIAARLQPDQGLLWSIFSLTSAEARLATIMAQARSPEAAAEHPSIKRKTVPNQLRLYLPKPTPTGSSARRTPFLSLHIVRGCP